jgi:hypothetical protein
MKKTSTVILSGIAYGLITITANAHPFPHAEHGLSAKSAHLFTDYRVIACIAGTVMFLYCRKRSIGRIKGVLP